jgi:hypothetical protein
MFKKIPQIWKFRLSGTLLAVLSALASSIIFYFADKLCLAICFPDIYISDVFVIDSMSFPIIVGIFSLTLFPAILGGLGLAYLQQRDARLGKSSSNRGMIAGGILGGIAAFLCSAGVISFLVFYAHRRPDPVAMLIHIINALVLATLSRMWTGKTFSKKMLV